MQQLCKIILRFTLYTLLPMIIFAQAGWGPDVRLIYRQGYSYDPKAVCCGDTIHVVWWESYVDNGIHEEVFYKRSMDAGETWETDVLLSIEDTEQSVGPQIAVFENVVHVVWLEWHYGLCYRRSLDGGATWQDIDSIVPAMVYSSVLTINDTVYIVGTIGYLGVLRFTKSYDGGVSWQPIVEITAASSYPRMRTIAENPQNLVVTYALHGALTCTEVFRVFSDDGGETWSDSLMISENDGRAGQCPAMDADDVGGIHVTWYDYKYSPYSWTGDIFYRASRDSCTTWEPIDSLTVAHRARHSDILVEGDNLHLVWDDDRNAFGDNEEIFYRMSTDLGLTWGSEVQLTSALCHSSEPSLACDGSYLHLFWSDRRDDGNNILGEIYYKRKDLSQGVADDFETSYSREYPFTTIFNGPLCLPTGKCCKIFDITGRQIHTFNPAPGIYFIEVGGEIVQKIIKIK